MAYRYYQTSYPGWGQSQLQFGPPPIPNIQPQPHWSAWDFYNAHAVNPDPSLFYNIMDRTRQYRGSAGVGKHEARTWHRRIYSGLVPLTQVLPADIGSAAAYEAYRGWHHHRHILYSCLASDIEREREALIGLAAAEASHLWQYSGRPMDAYGLREALESAAMTASRIAYQVMEDGDEYSRANRSSVIDGSYEGGYDDGYSEPRYHRSRRHSSFGSLAAPGMVGGAGSAYGTPYTGAAPMPMLAGSSVGTGYGANSSPYYGGGGLPQSYNGTPSLGGGYVGNSNPVIPGQPVGGFAVPYPGSSGSYTGSSPYLGAGGQYPQAGYGHTVVAGQTAIPNVPPGSTIIIQQQPSKHRRSSTSSGHKHHHRSRSSDPMRRYGSSSVAYRV
ncbi:hypothetical protein QCA50_004181 [Cerrena zonata]|uniref:Uncharacterized protein n=1 Tax=Cerrena zonata TaxID=2478898 RepID=A0AAW0GSN4_9APHY